MKILYYYDAEGFWTGSGESAHVVENSTELAPSGFEQRFDGTKWVTVETPEPTPEEKAQLVRDERDGLLFMTDWVVSRAYEFGEAVPAVWVAYRQALRDVPEQEGFPENVVWPDKPQ
jgi:hypothetical protein